MAFVTVPPGRCSSSESAPAQAPACSCELNWWVDRDRLSRPAQPFRGGRSRCRGNRVEGGASGIGIGIGVGAQGGCMCGPRIPRASP